jgi:transposase
MGEFGLVVPQGAARVKELVALVADPDTLVPAAARPALEVLTSTLTRLEAKIRSLEVEIVRRAKDEAVARRLMTIPGAGPLIATALVALAPPPQTFRPSHPCQ